MMGSWGRISPLVAEPVVVQHRIFFLPLESLACFCVCLALVVKVKGTHVVARHSEIQDRIPSDTQRMYNHMLS